MRRLVIGITLILPVLGGLWLTVGQGHPTASSGPVVYSRIEQITPAAVPIALAANDEYFDDFSNPSSGWPLIETLVIPETSTYYRARYENNQYRIMVDTGGPQIWFRQPTALAPYQPTTDRYCVEVDVRVMKAQNPYEAWNYYPYWANGGLVFGANGATTNLYILCLWVGATQYEGGPADMGWYLVNNPNSHWSYEGCHAESGSPVPGGEGSGLSTEFWHQLQVGVDGNQVKVWVDGIYKGRYEMPGLADMTRVGVVGGTYEVTPVDFFDNFRVIPNVDCDAMALLHNPSFDNDDWYEFSMRYQATYYSGSWLPDDDNNVMNDIPPDILQDWRLWFQDGTAIVEVDPEQTFVHSGTAAVQIRPYAGPLSNQIAGLYQPIYNTTPCLTYQFQMFAQSRPGDGDDTLTALQVGIDQAGWHPDSATDPAIHSFPATMVWGDLANFRGTYGLLSVTAEALNDRITVFTYVIAFDILITSVYSGGTEDSWGRM